MYSYNHKNKPTVLFGCFLFLQSHCENLNYVVNDEFFILVQVHRLHTIHMQLPRHPEIIPSQYHTETRNEKSYNTTTQTDLSQISGPAGYFVMLSYLVFYSCILKQQATAAATQITQITKTCNFCVILEVTIYSMLQLALNRISDQWHNTVVFPENYD